MNREQLEARKRALVAESEAYRETLRLDLAQLQLQVAGLRRRLQLVAIVPAALGLLPMIIRLIRPKASQQKSSSGLGKFLTAALAGWRLARRFAPLLSSLRRHRRNGAGTQRARATRPDF